MYTKVQSGTFLSMRDLGDFLRARIFRVGFPTLNHFIKTTGRSRQSVFNLLNAKRPPNETRDATVEAVARALQFVDWNEALEAWQENDVMAKLGDDDLTSVPVTPDAYRELLKMSADLDVPVDELIMAVAHHLRDTGKLADYLRKFKPQPSQSPAPGTTSPPAGGSGLTPQQRRKHNQVEVIEGGRRTVMTVRLSGQGKRKKRKPSKGDGPQS